MTAPRPHPLTEPPPAPAAGGVEQRLDELADLVRRRLLDDRDKRRMLDDLSDRLRAAEQGVARQILQPFVHGLALVLDRCDRYDGGDAAFAESVRDEILELLARHGVHDIPTTGALSLRHHEVVSVVQVDSDELAAPRIERVRRRGLHADGHVFRPAQVDIAVSPSTPWP